MKYYGVFSSSNKFFIADEEFNLLFETYAFKDGHFTDEVKQAIKDFDIDFKYKDMRTDTNLYALELNIKMEKELNQLYNERKSYEVTL